ncbi:type II toxin-antitoxin system HicA family toxin [Aquabacterium sp.]|uniref:type II toxin-antitoxin system HicA family toxin n=1 Tax=Aquabacterium sp. TaxID=1872578 RepID=UPI0035B49978
MPRKQSDVERSLTAKGYVGPQKGDHNYFTYHSKAGKKTRVFTKTSHGAKEIDDNILSQMAKQCKLTNKEFGRLIDCPLDRDTYEGMLIAQGLVEAPPAAAK